MRQLTLVIDEHTEGRTVKNLLKRELGLSNSLISHLKYRPDGITCNGRQVHTPEKLQRGDVLCVAVDDDPAPRYEAANALSLEVVFEDEDLLVINKPAGMEMHPDEDQLRNPSVRDSVLRHLGEGAVFHPVNRLDTQTSGLLAAAKHRYACDRLRRQLHTAEFVREYLALCGGFLPAEQGLIDTPVNGQDAKTAYWVLARGEGCSLVRFRLYTGRTHQIRIHMAEAGCALLGDGRYGTFRGMGRVALHSVYMELKHPVTGERLKLFCPPPEDFRQAAGKAWIPGEYLTEEYLYDI